MTGSRFNEDSILYMALTDRFSDGNSANNNQGFNEYRPGQLKYYQGGDWQGMINRFDYIKNLGVTALWISPVSDDQDLSKDGGEAGYHGYFTYDYNAPNPHFGTTAKLTELVNLAHTNNVAVVLDVVPNHTGNFLDPGATNYNPATNAPAAPFNNPSWYHHNGDITDWNNQYQVENYDLGGLDDLDQSQTAVRDAIVGAYQNWFNTTGADAARVDAARAMPKSFLQDFQTSLNVPTFGEIFEGNIDYVSDYQKYEWGVLDFPLFFALRDAFAYDKSLKNIGGIFDNDYKYQNPLRLVTFIDNHDRDRFLTVADDDWRRLRLAMTFIFAARGIPDIYYGTEQAYYGDGKPKEWQGIANEQNREMLTSYDQTHPMYRYIQCLSTVRKTYTALRRGTQREMWKDDTVYAFSRRVDTTGEEAIAAFTNAWDPQTRTIPLRAESTLAVGTVLTNALNTSQTVTVQSGGVTGKQITVNLGAKSSVIFVPGSVAAYAPPAATVTKVRVHYNVGMGNSVFLRGATYPLWWNQGRGMHNEGADLWTWQTERLLPGQCVDYKPLINDTSWSTGSNYNVCVGQTVDIYPNF
ncbi:alpha-amylase [Deinococcus metallilatus]|uniref:Alpha-amylase n=1 Tax=Deinococcus metallilatus TaxID=1211322 RepID=A0AAJ5F756_9DEIO|nr:alpha-amylase [Deinococcus metallilatus]RXJ11306.1 alpha-amylase [Deinococcus metallilatus]TLK24797.1 alpha-amylase [Deinococcus metallilatus]